MSSFYLAYQIDDQVISLRPGEVPCYRGDGGVLIVDNSTILTCENNPAYVPCLKYTGTSEIRDLPFRASFVWLGGEPVLSIGSYTAPVGPEEQPVVYHDGLWYDVRTQEILEMTRVPGVYVGIRRQGRVDLLPQGTSFQVAQCTVTASPPHIEETQLPPPTPTPTPTSHSIPTPTPTSHSIPRPTTTPPEETKKPISKTVPRPKPEFPTCSSCKQRTNCEISVFSLQYCLKCLLDRFEKGELRSPSRSGKCDWNAELIYELWTTLKTKLPPDSLSRLPEKCPLPLDSAICEGRRQVIHEDYPASGHIVGTLSIVSEGGCQVHPLCRACALKLKTCPKCDAEVTYEEPPEGCPSDCQGSIKSATFDTPCSNCGLQWPRKKHRSPPLPDQ